MQKEDGTMDIMVTLPLLLLFLFLTDRARFTRKWVWATLFALYMNAMLVTVGVPDYRYITFDATINWIPFRDFSASNILGMVLNIVMFLPFGAFLTIYFRKFQTLLPTAIASFGMSLAIELLQLFTFRTTDVDDLIMNTIGGIVGYGIGKWILRKNDGTDAPDRDVAKLVIMVLLCIAVVVFLHSRITNAIWPLLGLM